MQCETCSRGLSDKPLFVNDMQHWKADCLIYTKESGKRNNAGTVRILYQITFPRGISPRLASFVPRIIPWRDAFEGRDRLAEVALRHWGPHRQPSGVYERRSVIVGDGGVRVVVGSNLSTGEMMFSGVNGEPCKIGLFLCHLVLASIRVEGRRNSASSSVRAAPLDPSAQFVQRERMLGIIGLNSRLERAGLYDGKMTNYK